METSRALGSSSRRATPWQRRPGANSLRSRALRLLSLEGKEAEASALIAATIEHATARGQGMAVRVAQWAASVLYNGLARYEEALKAARQVTANDIDPYPQMWVLPELVEAATRVGESELAERGVRASGGADRSRPARTGRSVPRRARGHCSATARAQRISTRRPSSGSAGPVCAPNSPARICSMASGCAATGRRVDAREQLRTAHDMLSRIGMDAFAERARRELVATGERPRKRSAETRSDLTAQEAQIAQLAREGRSNQEIGAQLFLSPRTVEWHMRKVFGKLAISSRRQLDAALGTASKTGGQASTRGQPASALAGAPCRPARPTSCRRRSSQATRI